MSNFIDEEELTGRTIAKVITTDDRVSIAFTDGTWTSIAIDRGYYDSVEISFDDDASVPRVLGVQTDG